MSSFGGLSIAASGLSAARAALEVTGQNVANANTEGYTRQRVNQSPLAQTAIATYSTQNSVGEGVTVTGVSRVNDTVIDARVNSTASSASYWSASASAASTVESGLNEPGKNGLSQVLNDFWVDWHQMANNPGNTAVATTLLSQGTLVAATVSAGYTAAQDAWSDARNGALSTVSTINTTAAKIADLNASIRSLSASGANVNSLLDQRDAAVTALSKLTGSTTRSNADGTVDVSIGGNAIVSGVTSRTVKLVNADTFPAGPGPAPVALQWSGSGGSTVALDGGELAARIASLQGANGGTGGVFAEAAQAYNDVAKSVADKVNALHEQGTTSTGQPATGSPGLDFFRYTSADTAASSLSVVPTSVAGIAAADGTKGTGDNTFADKIAQIGTAADSPNASWSTYVSRVGSQVQTATARSFTADVAASAATTAQTSVGGVDLDEETSNLVIYQHAYQASARVISTIADVLDTLINMGAR